MTTKEGNINNEAIDHAIKRLVVHGKNKGFLKLDSIYKLISPEVVDAKTMEYVMNNIEKAGVTILDNNTSDKVVDYTALDTNIDKDVEEKKDEVSTINAPIETTYDPVRMYLKNMGGVHLLSRSSEIEIAKRIETGKKEMLMALCEFSLPMRQFILWYEDLVNEKILLREVIDLEAMTGENKMSQEGDIEEGDEKLESDLPKPESKESELNEEGEEIRVDEEEEGAEGSEGSHNMSVIALKESLLPQTLDKFKEVAKLCEKFSKG